MRARDARLALVPAAAATDLPPALRPPPPPASHPIAGQGPFWIQYKTSTGSLVNEKLGARQIQANGTSTGRPSSWKLMIYDNTLMSALLHPRFSPPNKQLPQKQLELGLRVGSDGRIWWLPTAAERLRDAANTMLLFQQPA